MVILLLLTNGVRTINRIYSYDATYRLTHEGLSVTDPVVSPVTAGVGYTLDDVGNRLARQSTLNSVLSTSSSFDANDRLTSDTYDANGNTVSGHVITTAPAVSDQYDFEDRLINRNNGQITLTYDGDGNRVSKTIGGVTTLYLVDDRNPSGYAQVLEEETTTGGTPVVTRVYAYGHSLISQDQFNGSTWLTSFYGTDGHGNVRYLTDTAGNLTDTYDYDAFGNLIAQTGSTANSYLYCGEQFDSDLGLYYNRARYLNPDAGRFWSRDTFNSSRHDPISLHRYLYANSNPIMLVDPSGHDGYIDTLVAQAIDNVVSAVANVGLRFAAGGAAAGGAALRQLGMINEDEIEPILQELDVEFEHGVTVAGEAGPRVIDYLLKIGDEVVALEAKYQLPQRAGPALNRLVAQMTAASQQYPNSQLAVFTFKEPSATTLARVVEALGPTANSVKFVHGFSELANWIQDDLLVDSF